MASVYQKTVWQIFRAIQKSYCLLYNATVLRLNNFLLYSLLNVFKQMNFLKYIKVILTASNDLEVPLKFDEKL